MNWRRLSNLPIMLLLRSPLHRLVSGSVLLISVRGRTTGQTYVTPVNYLRDGDSLLIVSRSERTWWRNLRGGVRVLVWLKGQELVGHGEVLSDPMQRRAALVTLIQQVPRYRQVLGIDLTEAGELTDPQALSRLTDEQVVVRLTKLGAKSSETALLDTGEQQERETA